MTWKKFKDYLPEPEDYPICRLDQELKTIAIISSEDCDDKTPIQDYTKLEIYWISLPKEKWHYCFKADFECSTDETGKLIMKNHNSTIFSEVQFCPFCGKGNKD